MPAPDGNDTGPSTPLDDGGIVTPAPVSPQEPGSDTLIEPTPPEAPPTTDVAPPSEQEVLLLKKQLAAQVNIQSGLDRTITSLQAQVAESREQAAELEATLTAYNTATTGTEGALTDIESERDNIRRQAQEYQERLAAALQDLERHKIVMAEYMGENPIARLMQADALPQAGNAEEFRLKMDAIAGSITDAAEQGHIVKIHGERPTASPPASGHMPSVDDLQAQMDVAMAAGDWDTFETLKGQRYELLGRVLPSKEDEQPRF